MGDGHRRALCNVAEKGMLTTVDSMGRRIAPEGALLQSLRTSNLVGRGHLLLPLVLGGRNKSRSSLPWWVGHDASEEVAWTMADSRRLRLWDSSMRRQTTDVYM